MSGSAKAISSRLASMGFMKKGAAARAAKSGQEQPPPAAAAAAAPPSLRQQQHHSNSADKHRRRQQQQQQQSHTAVDDSNMSQQGGPSPPQQQQQQQQQQQPAKVLSDGLKNMNFMKKGDSKKRSREEAFDKDQAAKDAAEWTTATAVQDRGCLIVHERDPLPAGVSGRMSFGFGHMFEQQQAEEAERAAAAEAAAAEAQIRDEDMAGRGFGKGWQGMMRTKEGASYSARHAKQQRRH